MQEFRVFQHVEHGDENVRIASHKGAPRVSPICRCGTIADKRKSPTGGRARESGLNPALSHRRQVDRAALREAARGQIKYLFPFQPS